MSSATPLVSVVTPSYNHGRFLDACLASVRGQRYPRVEHVLQDACSTDDTADVVARFAKTYDLRAQFEKDAGQADALNRGFDRARGDILCWLNADDYWLHDRVLEEAVDALRSGADVVTATGCYVDVAGRRIAPVPLDPRWVPGELRYHDPVLQPATFWRRSVHRPLRVGLDYAFDWQLWLDLHRADAQFLPLDREWAAYRLHANKTALDPARRRREIAEILRAECGGLSPQHLWARGIYGAFLWSERLQWRALKRVALVANDAMKAITRRRVFSC